MKARDTQRNPRDGRNAGWIFRWKKLDGPWFPKWMAVAIVAGAFVLLYGAVRVEIVRPSPWIGRKASVIYLPPGAEGRQWALRAREEGPFPSRFEPEQSPGAEAMEEVMRTVLREPPAVYVPPLRELPAEMPVPPVSLLEAGGPVFPERKPPPRADRTGGGTKLVPVLYPLSGLPLEQMPEELPAYDAAAEGVSSIPWRFLVRLRSDGSVAESVPLVGAETPGLAPLEGWLRGIRFAADPEADSRWIAVGIGFINQPSDGSDAR